MRVLVFYFCEVLHHRMRLLVAPSEKRTSSQTFGCSEDRNGPTSTRKRLSAPGRLDGLSRTLKHALRQYLLEAVLTRRLAAVLDLLGPRNQTARGAISLGIRPSHLSASI